MSNPKVPISPAGMRRREAILRLAQRQALRKRLRRRGGYAAMVVITLCVVGAILREYVRPPSSQEPRPLVKTTGAVHVPRVPAAAAPAVTITWISTDPGITDRLAIRSQHKGWKELDDERFLQVLAAAGQPAGLIRMDGRTYLLRR